MKVLRLLQRLVLAGLSLLGICTILATAICLALSIRPVIVISGSMEPAVPNGALVLHKQVPASSLKVDDVVTVNRTDHNGVVTHRIVAIKPEGEGRYALTLRGDSNEQNDPQPYVVTQADRLEASVPYLGGVLMWMRQHPVVTAVILLALLGFSLWPAQRFTVHTADGQVLNNLTRREAKRYLDEAKAFRDQASAGVAGGQTPGQETNHAAAN